MPMAKGRLVQGIIHWGDPNCEGHGRETLAISSLQHGLSFVLLAPQLLLEET